MLTPSGQSPSPVDGEVLSPDAGVVPLDFEPASSWEPAAALSVEPASAAPLPDFAVLLVRRSRFAQPLPLNTIVGGANALRIEPSAPHSGQKWGPGSWTPWRMSARWLQTEQTYS